MATVVTALDNLECYLKSTRESYLVNQYYELMSWNIFNLLPVINSTFVWHSVIQAIE